MGRLLLVDALGMGFRTLKLRKNPDCPVCGTHPTVTELIDYDQFCGIEKPKDLARSRSRTTRLLPRLRWSMAFRRCRSRR